jgi:cell division protein FtsQ
VFGDFENGGVGAEVTNPKLLNAIANGLLGLAALSVLLAGIKMVITLPMFTLRVIQIEGAGHQTLRHVNAHIIRSTVLTKIKGNFFTANLDSIRTAFELTSWVRKANVRRVWPNRLMVTLEEHVPLGTWGEQGQLLSVQGEVFTANLAEAEEDAELLDFSGPPGSEKEVLAHYLALKDWFKPIGLTPQIVKYSKRYAWSVKLNNQMTVQLGREEDSIAWRKRVERFVAVYPQLAERLPEKIERVDLRYPHGFSIQRTDDGKQRTVSTGNQA